MKFLIDFDGTLTNIQSEYQKDYDLVVKHMADLGVSAERFKPLFDRAIDEIMQHPTLYGWPDNGRLSAFCDEDVFMHIIAGIMMIHEHVISGDEAYSDIRQALDNAGVSLMDVAESCHQAMSREPLDAFNTPQPEVVSVLRTLLDRDCEIVIASNSGAQRITEKLKFVDLKPVAHEDNPSARFRVRGDARKYALDDVPNPVVFGSRTIDVARSHYAKIIREERPQVIIGDVFSLDLALPIEMARREPMIYGDMQIYLRTRPYTPQWAIDNILNPPDDCPVTARILNHFADLPSLVLRR